MKSSKTTRRDGYLVIYEKSYLKLRKDLSSGVTDPGLFLLSLKGRRSDALNIVNGELDGDSTVGVLVHVAGPDLR